jgi:hypothetical protein
MDLVAALFSPEWMETRSSERFSFLLPVRVQLEWVVSGTIVSELINLNMHD